MAEKGWLNYNELPDEPFAYGTRIGISDVLEPENLRLSVITFDPGNRGPLHYHKDPIEECYVILEGNIDIHIEDDVVNASEGEVILLPPETEHYPHNTYDEPARFIVVSSPNVSPDDDTAVVTQEDNTVVVEEVD